MIKRILKPVRSKLFAGTLIGLLIVIVFDFSVHYTSTDTFCERCHVHPHATATWKRSTHVDNNGGITVHCIECHLPPGGLRYYTEKARLGIKDVWGKLTKDPEELNWDEKSTLEYAKTYLYKGSCVRCHANLFPLQLSQKGEDAHLYYSQKPDELRCINCHLHTGHYSEEAEAGITFGNSAAPPSEVYREPASVKSFENYTEYIPGSRVKFDMIAVKGGTFTMGSPENEPYRSSDEGPQAEVTVGSFWMGTAEVSWNEYEEFFRQTKNEGRTDTRTEEPKDTGNIEAITGATPPYGNPDQGWGKGERPAITMTWHAANVYCRWLSKVTGKKYRLPTEAEWEYACRGGTDTPYFTEGSPKDYSESNFWNTIFGKKKDGITGYILFDLNSRGKTGLPEQVKPNPFGLLNMAGNVWEFCSDWYAPDIFRKYQSGGPVTDPSGPESGKEHVIRGGSFKSDAADVRSAEREPTRHDAWLVTDPQIPKSIWWYSDCIDVGFRVVCEYGKK